MIRLADISAFESLQHFNESSQHPNTVSCNVFNGKYTTELTKYIIDKCVPSWAENDDDDDVGLDIGAVVSNRVTRDLKPDDPILDMSRTELIDFLEIECCDVVDALCKKKYINSSIASTSLIKSAATTFAIGAFYKDVRYFLRQRDVK